MKTAFFVTIATIAGWAQSPKAPNWVHLTPEREGRVYAVGVAAMGPIQATSIQEAIANARTQVVARLRVSVFSTSAQQKTASVQAEGKTQSKFAQEHFAINSEQKIQAMDLPGIAIEATFVDTPGKTAYALAYLDVTVAEQEFQGRWAPLRVNALTALDLPAQSPRERLRKLSRLRALMDQLAPMRELATLISAASPSSTAKMDVESVLGRMDGASRSLKASLTFAITGAEAVSTGGDLKESIKNGLLKHGFEWSDQAPQLTLAVHSMETPKQGELSSIRAAVHLKLQDATGASFESLDFEARGVGTDMIQARSKLLRDIRNQLPEKLNSWLDEITR